MKLQYDMAQKNLNDIANWIGITKNKREIKRDKMDGKLSATASIAQKARVEKEAAQTLTPSRECPVIKFVPYEGEGNSTGTDEGNKLTGNMTTRSKSSTAYSSDGGESPEMDGVDRWKARFDVSGVGMVAANMALIDHRQDMLRLPNGMDQLYATTGKQNCVFHIALPKIESNQYWCTIQTNTA